MAQILDIVTVGEKTIYNVDQDPAAGAGTPAEIGSLALLESGSSIGEAYLKVGAADTAWDKFTTATSGSNVKQGNFRRLAIYDTDANGFTVDDQIDQNGNLIDVILEAQPSRASSITYQIPNPGDAISAADFVLTEGAQTINGDKTFSDNVTINGNLDVNGTLTSIDTTNTTIQDKLITLNKGGGVASGADSGIEFEEDGIITGYFKVNGNRDGFLMQAPGVAGDSNFLGTAGDQNYNLPDEDGRLVLQDAGITGVIQQIPYWGTDEKLNNPTGVAGNSLTWDAGNERLGVGTAAPSEKIHVANGNALFQGDRIHRVEDDVRYSQATGSTTDATFTSIKNIAIPNDSIVMIEARVKGRKTGGTGAGSVGDGACYVRTIAVKNVGGTVTRIRRQSDFTAEDVNGFNCQLEISGTNVQVQVKGTANNNVTWQATTKTEVLD